MATLEYTPIGVVRSPFRTPQDMPIQPGAARRARGRIELDPHYEEGLRDLDGFSHILIVSHLHQCQGYSLLVTPFLDDQEHGLFATRAPRRPNPIGVSVVRLLGVEGMTLHVDGVDLLDGTPVLDIKPHVPRFDADEPVRIGWLEGKTERLPDTRSDGRFARSSVRMDEGVDFVDRPDEGR